MFVSQDFYLVVLRKHVKCFAIELPGWSGKKDIATIEGKVNEKVGNIFADLFW